MKIVAMMPRVATAKREIHARRLWRDDDHYRWIQNNQQCQVCRLVIEGTKVRPHASEDCFVQFAERVTYLQATRPTMCLTCGGDSEHPRHRRQGCGFVPPACNQCMRINRGFRHDHAQWTAMCLHLNPTGHILPGSNVTRDHNRNTEV
uniref:Uncharacterized protein n=1 Tax=Caenorhabditis japonica TaxID=281687 RepID=A0A8R1EGB1_CAEJA